MAPVLPEVTFFARLFITTSGVSPPTALTATAPAAFAPAPPLPTVTVPTSDPLLLQPTVAIVSATANHVDLAFMKQSFREYEKGMKCGPSARQDTALER